MELWSAVPISTEVTADCHSSNEPDVVEPPSVVEPSSVVEPPSVAEPPSVVEPLSVVEPPPVVETLDPGDILVPTMYLIVTNKPSSQGARRPLLRQLNQWADSNYSTKFY